MPSESQKQCCGHENNNRGYMLECITLQFYLRKIGYTEFLGKNKQTESIWCVPLYTLHYSPGQKVLNLHLLSIVLRYTYMNCLNSIGTYVAFQGSQRFFLLI